MRDTISWPPRDAPRRGSPFLGIVVLAVLITVVTFTYSAARGRAAHEHPVVVPATPTAKTTAGDARGALGIPMRRDTTLRLLTADPPALVDVRRRTTTPVPGIPHDDRVYDVVNVAGEAVIVGTRACVDCVPSGEAYILRDGKATSLGPAWSVAPSLDGRGVWILRYVDRRRCALREVDLDGDVRHPEQPIDCRARLRKETTAGLLMDVAAHGYGRPDSVLLNPVTGGVVGRYPRIDAVTRHFTLTRTAGRIVLEGSGHTAAAGSTAQTGQHVQFNLIDLHSGTKYPLPWPSRLSRTGASAVGPGGRFVAVKFIDPAAGGARQLVDVWVLDTVARRWQQLPGMPADSPVTSTSMAWTLDGRLVILGNFDSVGDAAAVWSPGEGRLAVRRIELPDERSSGSFTVLSAALPSR